MRKLFEKVRNLIYTQGKKKGPENMAFWLLLLDHLLPSFVTLEKLFNCSKNHFSHLQSGYNSCAFFTEM